MDEIVGRNPVLEALRAGRKINKLVIAKGAKGNVIRDIKNLPRPRVFLAMRLTAPPLQILLLCPTTKASWHLENPSSRSG